MPFSLTKDWSRHFGESLSPIFLPHFFCYDDKYKLARKCMQSYINNSDISNTVGHFTYMNPQLENKLFLASFTMLWLTYII